MVEVPQAMVPAIDTTVFPIKTMVFLFETMVLGTATLFLESKPISCASGTIFSITEKTLRSGTQLRTRRNGLESCGHGKELDGGIELNHKKGSAASLFPRGSGHSPRELRLVDLFIQDNPGIHGDCPVFIGNQRIDIHFLYFGVLLNKGG